MLDAPAQKITIRCGGCEKRAKVAARHAGRKLRCGCGETLRVPGTKIETRPRSAAREEHKARKTKERSAPRPERRPKERASSAPRLYHHEEHVRAISAWMRLQAVITLGILGLLGLKLGFMGTYLIFGIFFTWAGAQFAAGQLLWDYDPRARIATAGLLGVPLLFSLYSAVITGGGVMGLLVSAGWAGAVAWALFGPKGKAVFQSDYRRRVAAEQVSIRWWKSPFWYVPWGLFVLGVMLIFSLISIAG